MPKKIVVVNAGPRKGWNTDTLLMEAAKGAEATGAEIVKLDLFKLENIPAVFPALAVRGKSLRGTVSAGTALLRFCL